MLNSTFTCTGVTSHILLTPLFGICLFYFYFILLNWICLVNLWWWILTCSSKCDFFFSIYHGEKSSFCVIWNLIKCCSSNGWYLVLWILGFILILMYYSLWSIFYLFYAFSWIKMILWIYYQFYLLSPYLCEREAFDVIMPGILKCRDGFFLLMNRERCVA